MYYIHIKISLLSIVPMTCLPSFPPVLPKRKKNEAQNRDKQCDTQSQTLKWMDIKQTNEQTNSE